MENQSRPLSAFLHQAIATGNIEKVQELLKEGACANTPLYINEHIVEKVRRASKTASIGSKLSVASTLGPISESPTTTDLVATSSMETSSLSLNTNDQIIQKGNTNDNIKVGVTITENALSDETHSDVRHNTHGTISNPESKQFVTASQVVVIHDEMTDAVPHDQTTDVVPHNEMTDVVPHNEMTDVVPHNEMTDVTTHHEMMDVEKDLIPDEEMIKKIKIDSTENLEVIQHVTPGVIHEKQDNPPIKGDAKNDYETDGGEVQNNENDEPVTKNSHHYEEAVVEDIEAIMATLQPLANQTTNINKAENNNRKRVADTIEEKLRDDNETLIERAPSVRKADANEETDKSPLKILPRIKRKLSMKWRNRAKIKDNNNIEEDDGFEEFYENVPKTRNVDDEQLNENYEGVAFFEAVREGMDMIVQTLLETSNNYQLDLPDENGFTPTMQAAWHGQKDCLQILLEHGADIEQPNTAGCTAAHFAAGQGHYQCLELLLENSEKHYEATEVVLTTPPITMSSSKIALWRRDYDYNSHPDKIDNQSQCNSTTSSKKSIVNVRTKFGATALILASRGGHKECVELLLKHGADPNIKYRGNQNSLLFAAGNGHYECLQALLDYDVEVNQANSQGVTSLMRAVQQGHNPCVVLLLDHGADVDLQDSIGRTALHFAVEHKNAKAVKLLLQADAAIDLKTKGGSTVLTYAERFQSVKCAEILENHINELKELERLEEEAKKIECIRQCNEMGIATKEKQKPKTCGVFKNIFQRKKRVPHE